MARPKKDVETTTMRLEVDAYEIARKAAAIHGESIVSYASRVIREYGTRELIEDARKTLKESEKGAKPKPKGKEPK